MAKTLVLGLGNPILCDDGVGLRVAAGLEGKHGQDVTVLEASLAGLDLLDLMVGYDRAIIVDAIQTEGSKPGTISWLNVASFRATRHAASIHDVDLPTALELGKRLGLALPRRIDVLAIEVADVTNFSEECTPEVAAAIPECIRLIIDEIKGTAQ